MAATPSGKGIPWHRVVGDHGKVLIPEPHGSLQRKILQTEGVELVEFRVDLKRYLWTPGKATKPIQKSTAKRNTKRRP
jgi:alkylated DNA nucleotide flippase Atl1